MSTITIWKCDLCGAGTKAENEVVMLIMPVPTGHESRTDCWEPEGKRHFCKKCLGSYRRWWNLMATKGEAFVDKVLV